NFNDPARWRDDLERAGVPGPGDNANITLAGGDTVTVTADQTVNRLLSAAPPAVNPRTALTVANVAHNSRIAHLAPRGTLRPAGGPPQLTDNSDLRGTLDTAAGATLDLNSGTHQLNAGAAFAGAGLYRIGAALTVNAAFATAATLELTAD